MNPTVSLVVATWNRESTLREAITSALRQTHPILEVLVCDDGSTDGSRPLIESLGDGRVRWIAGDHFGRPAVPRNRGLAQAQGEWIAFLDSDDAWLPRKTELQLSHVLAAGQRAVCSNALRMTPSNRTEWKPLLSISGSRMSLDDLLKTNHIICSSAMIHRSVLAQAIGFPESTSLRALEDYAFWLRIATQTDFDYVPEPLVLYRDDPENSLRHEQTSNLWVQRQRVIGNLLEWTGQEGREPMPTSRLRMIRRFYYEALARARVSSVKQWIKSRL